MLYLLKSGKNKALMTNVKSFESVFILTSPQSVLSVVSHSVCFIEDDQFISRLENSPSARKVHDLPSYDSNTSVVRSIQF